MGHHGHGFGGGRGFGGRGFGGGGFWGGPRGFFGPSFGLFPLMRPMYWYGAPWGGWMLTETALILLMGAAAFKISQSDAERLRSYTGHNLNDLSEDELAEAMRRLGIQQMSLTDDERQLVIERTPEKPKGANPADVLRELKRLRDEGILSEEEYQSRKARILDTLTG